MKVLIVGSGGREHALAWKLSQSSLVDKIYAAPGNGGTAQVGENVAIKDDDVYKLAGFAKKNGVGLVVIGPELPLTKGLANIMRDEGIPCFGPTEYAAGLEGSKSFAKAVMLETGVPTAHFAVFEELGKAKKFVEERGAPLVVKADGLAAGKGVILCESVDRAMWALDEVMLHKNFGASGDKVVIEEMLIGEEVSFLAFCDGKNYRTMPTSQDHKAAEDGDKGPNTGGMGAFSPACIVPPSLYDELGELVIRPVIDYMRAKGHPFVGVLYAGLIITDEGPKVLEYNVRFGDPECQPLLMRLDSDLAEIMLACAEGRLDKIDISWSDKTALCVVMAAKGYPGPYPKGMDITGITPAEASGRVKVFQAGTKVDEGRIVTSGGRVLGVTALGDGLADASRLAYAAVADVTFRDAAFRRDIGAKGLKWEGQCQE